jgi:uncharacterized protein YlaN (UPF0358 family)
MYTVVKKIGFIVSLEKEKKKEEGKKMLCSLSTRASSIF